MAFLTGGILDEDALPEFIKFNSNTMQLTIQTDDINNIGTYPIRIRG